MLNDAQDLKDLIKHMLDALSTVSEGLTDWEKQFVESLSEQFDKKGSLSIKQREILERIYDEKSN